VPPDYVVEEESYLMNEEALRTVYATIRTYREERNLWIDAYDELKTKSEAFAEYQRKSLAELRDRLDEERAAWKKELRKAKGPGVGVFIGAGYTGDGYEVVIGAGVVWKLF
jgi:hypothetical protein